MTVEATLPPYETEVLFAGTGDVAGAGAVAGTLRRPDTAADGPVPAALLVSGSGPLDRDGNHRRMRPDIQRQLAEALAASGIASLRYDKRGVGASGGSFLAAGLQDNVADAEAALAALRAQAGVDREAVYVVGHSEGAIIAAAVLAGGARAAGGVLLSPTARPGEDVLLWQVRGVAGDVPAPVRLLLRLLRTDLERKVVANHRKLEATTGDVVRMGGVRVNARWHREFMAHDPRADLARIPVPVLALTGTKDLQAPPEDLAVIEALVPGEVETVRVDDVSHVLRAQPGPATLRSYKKDIRRPVDARVLDAVTGWVSRQARSRRGEAG